MQLEQEKQVIISTHQADLLAQEKEHQMAADRAYKVFLSSFQNFIRCAF